MPLRRVHGGRDLRYDGRIRENSFKDETVATAGLREAVQRRFAGGGRVVESNVPLAPKRVLFGVEHFRERHETGPRQFYYPETTVLPRQNGLKVLIRKNTGSY